MGVSVGLAMLRVLTGISILWLIVPGYGIALGLSFVVPKIFTAIAFDSGGAMVAMTPLITIQVLGLVYQLKSKAQKQALTPEESFALLAEDAIIEL